MFFASILALSFFMFYMPTSYSQTESDEFVQEQSEQPQQQLCAEGEVFNEQTQICESIATPTETPTEAPSTDEIQMDTNGDGVVDAKGETTTPTETPTEAETTTTGAAKSLYQSQQFNCDPNSANLQVGTKGEKVIELQTYLTDLGYGDLLEPEKIDGKFGPHTKNSVMTYQKDFGLSVDGIVGPQTWGSLCEQVSLLPTTFPSKSDASSTTDSSQCDPNTSCPKINVIYNDVELVPQSTSDSCWAATTATIVGFDEKVCIADSEIAKALNYWKEYQQGLPASKAESVFAKWGLVPEPPQSYTVDGFASLLSTYGPLWIATAEPSGHVRVVTGIMGDGTPEGTILYISDPWPPGVGSSYTETYQEFVDKQENFARNVRGIAPIYVAHLP